jgi:hypothetical protein
MRTAGVVAIVVLPACSFTPGTFTSGDGGNDTRSDDSNPVAGWSEPQPIVELSDPDGADDPSLTGDLLEIYFGSHRAGSMGGIEEDIWMAKRNSVSEPFGSPINVTELNTMYVETTPKITPNGKAIFFATNRPGGGPQIDIWVSTRSSRSVTWGPPGKVAEIMTSAGDYAAFANDELLHLIYCNGVTGDEALYTSDRANTLALWGAPVKVDELDETGINECDPMEPSELALYYSTNYLTAGGTYDIYRAARPTVDDPYGSRTSVDLVNKVGYNDRDPWVSADEQTMVFSSDRGNVNFELYITTR